MSQTLLVSGIGGGNRTNQGVRFDIQFGFGMGIGWSTGHNSQGSKKWKAQNNLREYFKKWLVGGACVSEDARVGFGLVVL